MQMKKQRQGLTLIEVLIALAILSIALTAVIKATSQNIRSTTYLQDKTIALWVAQLVLNEARVGATKLPDPPDKLQQEVKMLDRKWYYQAKQEPTGNKRIERVKVNVYSSNDFDNATPLINLESYYYRNEKT